MGPWARDNKQKAKVFAEHLADIFTANQNNENIRLEEITNISTENILPVTPKEVAIEIKANLNSRKASGFDLIPGKILKNLPKKGIVFLTYLFNAVFRLKHVPAC